MADGRITQLPTLVIRVDETEGRVTTAAAQVLYQLDIDARVTTAAAQVLYEVVTQARVSNVAMQVLVAKIPCLRKRCQVWKIVRTDGEEFLFTTHDEPVSFHGDTYQPCSSLQASAAESATLNAVGGGDIQIRGLISDSSITERDMVNGLFDGADVEVWEVPWNDSKLASDSPKRLLKGVLGETTQGPNSYDADVYTNSAKLAQNPLLETYSPACRFTPGDGKCPVDVDALTTTGFVDAGVTRIARDRRSYRQFYYNGIPAGSSSGGVSSSSSENGGTVWINGLLTWTTGNNAGIQSEVKSYDSDGVVTLWDAMPYEIAAGDHFSIRPGCNKTEDAHVNDFGLSMESFGGFPDIPGLDSIVRGPTR